MKILSLSHNAFWGQIQKLEKCRDDVENLTIAGTDGFLINKNKDDKFNQDFDVIIYYGSYHYNMKIENDLIDYATKISNENNKKVCIGYSYVIPNYEREDPHIFDGVKFISVKDNCFKEEDVEQNDRYFTILDLANITIDRAKDDTKKKVKR